MPADPTEAPPATAPTTSVQPYAVTTLLQQPGFVAPDGVPTTVTAGYVAPPPANAGKPSDAANQSSGRSVTKSQNGHPPTSGLRSLWQSFLGTNATAQKTTAASSNRQAVPTQYPPPSIASVVPASTNASNAAGSLFGQFAGTQAASQPATIVPATKAPTTNPLAASSPQAGALIQRNDQQTARRLPEARQVSNEELKPVPIAPVGAGDGLARDSRPAAPPYAVTSAPARTYPPGAIPLPTALGQLPQTLSNSTQAGGALSGLLGPLAASPRKPALPQTAGRVAAAPAPSPATATTQNSGSGGESGMASLVLLPFQLTNGEPAPANSSAANIASNSRPSDRAGSVPGNSLLHQLSMTLNGGDYTSEEEESDAGPEGGSRLLRGEQIAAVGTRSATGAILQTAATDEKNAKGDRELVALMQELAPEPADLNAETGELVPEPAPEPADADAAEAKKEDSLGGAEKLGEAPQDRTLDFLRAETVLLKPGESQCDVGISYIFTDNDFPILLTDANGNIVQVGDVRFLVRELTVPLEYRVGLAKRVQGFINLPVGWSNTQLNIASEEAFINDGGLGDLTFGTTIQCVEATANCPYVITTISGTAPTGGDPFTGVVGISPTAPSLGNGFWSVQGTVLFIQQYDPVVVFYGLGMQRSFQHEYVGIEFEPGAQYSYLLGFGFAVNERITLSTRFFGSYVEELEANGQRVLGTNTEPMTIRMSATISKPSHHKKGSNRLVEPYVEFGLNDDSVNSNVGITWTF